MRHLPIFLDLQGQTVLVAGGGEQAAQKLRLLTRTPARLRVLSADPCPEVLELARTGRVELERREAEPRDVVGARLVYVALEDGAAAARIAATARAAGIPVNAVDRPELCDFITPALVDRDPVVIAIGTEGNAPVLGRQLRARLEALLPSRLGDLVRWAGDLRERVAESASARSRPPPASGTGCSPARSRGGIWPATAAGPRPRWTWSSPARPRPPVPSPSSVPARATPSC